jgi:hypothetical protein
MILLSALVLAQSVFTYSDSQNDMMIRANNGMGTMTPAGWQFDLRGKVNLLSKKEKVSLTASQVKADIASGKDAKRASSIRRAVATGGVVIVQTAESQTAKLNSSTATYKALGAKGQVDARGAVRIETVNSQKKQTLVATGSSAIAILNKSSKKGIESATLNGPVRVQIVQSAGESSTIVFTGNKLTLAGNQVTLTGNVRASGQGAARFGNLGNVDSVVAMLNDKGELTSFKFRSGSGK